LPAHLRDFNGLLLHDAELQSLARNGQRLLMVLHKDIPPRNLVVLTYELTADSVLVAFAASPRTWGFPARFDFDEFDRDQDIFTQCICFNNGWELRLRFRDVQIALAQPLLPPSPVAPASLPAQAAV
jgi:hypothetical protein